MWPNQVSSRGGFGISVIACIGLKTSFANASLASLALGSADAQTRRRKTTANIEKFIGYVEGCWDEEWCIMKTGCWVKGCEGWRRKIVMVGQLMIGRMEHC